MTSFKYQKSTGFRNDRLEAVVRGWCWVDDLRLEADTEGAYSSECPQGRSKPPQPSRARGGFHFWLWGFLFLAWSGKYSLMESQTILYWQLTFVLRIKYLLPRDKPLAPALPWQRPKYPKHIPQSLPWQRKSRAFP